jgi:hypothetical protein
MGIEVLLRNSAVPLGAIPWEIVRQVLAKIKGSEETEVSLEHVPTRGNWAEHKQVLATEPRLAVQGIREQVVLSAAVTASEISECPPVPLAPGEVGSGALAVVRPEPAANEAPPAWVHAVVAAVAEAVVAVAGAGKHQCSRKNT